VVSIRAPLSRAASQAGSPPWLCEGCLDDKLEVELLSKGPSPESPRGGLGRSVIIDGRKKEATLRSCEGVGVTASPAYFQSRAAMALATRSKSKALRTPGTRLVRFWTRTARSVSRLGMVAMNSGEAGPASMRVNRPG